MSRQPIPQHQTNLWKLQCKLPNLRWTQFDLHLLLQWQDLARNPMSIFVSYRLLSELRKMHCLPASLPHLFLWKPLSDLHLKARIPSLPVLEQLHLLLSGVLVQQQRELPALLRPQLFKVQLHFLSGVFPAAAQPGNGLCLGMRT